MIYRLILILGPCSPVSAPLNPSGCDDVVMLASICSYGDVFAELHFHGWGVLGEPRSFWVVVSVGDISDFFGHIISRLLSEWDVTVGF